MGYSREVYDAAMAELNRRRTRAEGEAQERRAAFYALFPRAREIQGELAHLAAGTAKAVFGGNGAAQAMERLRNKSLALQKERESLLQQAGLEKDALKPAYTCGKCQDTGFIDGRMCNCLKGLLRQEAYRRLNEMTPLTLSGFEQFDLRYYSDRGEGDQLSPRAHMEQVLAFCRQYAEKFSLHSESLLFQGRTGLGKTHLSLAIAREAIQKGYGVVYGSVQNFVTALEKERFGRDGGEDRQDTNQMLLHCDLLILDDLGTELTTAFTQSALYELINGRLLAGKPTVISTNLLLADLEKRYSPQIVSRLKGEYEVLPFFGEDIRRLKRELG